MVGAGPDDAAGVSQSAGRADCGNDAGSKWRRTRDTAMTNDVNRTDWHALSATLPLDGRPFIGGKRIQAASDAEFRVCKADDNSLITTLPDCGDRDVDAAVRSARAAYDSGIWSDESPSQRGRVLRRFADLIERDAATLALLDTVQMGMPITQSLAAAPGAVEIVRSAADLVDKVPDLLIPSAASAIAMQIRRPHGVVAAITPWNYPVHVGLGRIAPALAAGNCVILKPSEIAPLALLRLAELASEAGLPDGVLNALPGRGEQTGRLLAMHMDVDCLAFTGSTATGLKLMQYAGQSNMKALHLECGGKSPQIVFDDGGDIDMLADVLVQGFVHNSGQVCVSGSRILVAEGMHDRLLAALEARVSILATGRAIDPETGLGPLASASQFGRITGMLDNAGAELNLVAKGSTVGGGPNEVAPHLFAGSNHRAMLVQEEIFGPVAVVLPFRDADDAVRCANDTRYGLSANLWCSDFTLSHQVARRLRAGFVSVSAVANPQPADEGPMAGEPFGSSGIGAYGGVAGLQAFTRVQATTFHLR